MRRMGVLLLLLCCTSSWAQDRLARDAPSLKAGALPPLVPYRLEITPAGAASDTDAITLRAARMPLAGQGATEIGCQLSIRPRGGTGQTVTGANDPGCTQPMVTRLGEGQYLARLEVGWRPAGATTRRVDAEELAYEVRRGDRVVVRPLRVEPQRPETNQQAKLRWEVVNVGPLPLGGVVVELYSGAQLLERKTIGNLAPTRVHEGGFGFTEREATRKSFRVVVDPAAQLGEPEAHRANNTATLEVEIAPGAPPAPVLMLGPLQAADGRANWKRELSICNVDPQAEYRTEVRGPVCLPVPCLPPFPGRPASGDFDARGGFVPSGMLASPRCPAAFTHAAALNPGHVEGPIGHLRDHSFEVTVVARRNGREARSPTARFTVPAGCRFPLCTPLEQ